MNAMKKKLFVYMVLLAGLLVLAGAMGLFLLGRFYDARRETYTTLDLQMAFFEKEITSQFENAAAMGIQMSGKMKSLIDGELAKKNIGFDDLNDSEEEISALEDSMFEPLRQFLLESGCSGAFVILDTTVNRSASETGDSRSGLYLELGGNSGPEDILLYRGSSAIGKSHGVYPHRKWRLEFRTNSFPGYKEALSVSPLPPERSYRFSGPSVLPGTSEKAVFLTVPISGGSGKTVGVCGFEINESLFKKMHAQSSSLTRLLCLLDMDGGVTIAPEQTLSSGIFGGYYEAPDEELTAAEFSGGLSSFTGEKNTYIGIRRTTVLSPSNPNVLLAVMIPKADYRATVRRNAATIIIFVLLLGFFAVTISMYFSRKYLSPIMKEISEAKAEQEAAKEEALRAKNEKEAAQAEAEKAKAEQTAAQAEAERAKHDFERVAPKAREEIDSDSFEIFKENLKKLTPKESEIFELYLGNHTTQEILDAEGFTVNALKYHNKNIYSKLGVTSKKELLKYITLLQHGY